MTFDFKPSAQKPPPYDMSSPSQRLVQLLETASQEGRDVTQLRSRVQTLQSYLTPTEGRTRKAETAQDLLEDCRSSQNTATLARQFGIAEEEYVAFKDFEEDVKEAIVCDCERQPTTSSQEEGETHSPVARVAGAVAMGVGAVVVAPVAVAAGIAGGAVFMVGAIVCK